MTAPSAPPPRRGFVSSVFGDHMVLQRAPQRARLWGFTRSNATVSVTIHASARLRGRRGRAPRRPSGAFAARGPAARAPLA